ncbi:hypothetical protein [Nocardioides rubriscoriae]|uniref:hypothetical protein n=1 Tax=Nocardioides rubriscoriae TaxID=642762 RepID=UPI0011E0073E|nr:hypothetical protein [Nocardioides rubriscoriae]
MRLRRRADDASDAPGAPRAAVGGVETVFAGVLDGRRLWLAIAAQPGVLALRGPDGVVDLPREVDDRPGHLAARLDLASLPAAATSYDVVLVADGRATPLVTGPLPAARVPAAPGGDTRHVLERADDATLRLRTEPLAPAYELVTVDAGPDALRLEVTGPDGPLTLDTDDLLGQAGPTMAPVLVGPDRLPVRRRDDDLPDPGRGAPLPSVGRLRLRWSGDGLLRARLAEADEA